MKKALAFVAAALVAVASQAATVQWTSGTIYVAKDAAGTWGTASTDKAKSGLANAQYIIVDAATYDTYVNDGAKMYADWTTLVKNATVKSDVINSSGGAAANWSDPTDYTKSMGTIYCLALYKHTSADYGDFYIAAAGSGSVNDFGEFEGTYSGLAASNKPWVAASVPEPCTVALLALGLAAVGLKRKVA